MTRIATNAVQQSALADIMRAQRELNLAQNQFTSGKIADDLKGFGGGAETLAATRSVLNRENGYAEAGKRLTAQLEAQALAISEVSSAAGDLRTALTETVGLGDGRILMEQIDAIAGRAANALNTKFGGAYLFGGGRENAQPISYTGLDDLAAAPAAADLFNNGDIRGAARLQDGVSLQTGVLADELGADLMAAIKRIKDFANANGGFSDELTPAEQDFLTAEIQTVKAAFDAIGKVEARNGLAQNNVEESVLRSGERAATLEILLSDLEDADMAEVASRLQQAQLALEASARVFSTLSRTSLLDFLR